jgi:hypothetical protein
MRAHIALVDDFGLDHRQDIIRDQRTAGNTFLVLAHGQLVHLSTGLESEEPDQLHGRGFIQDRDGQLTAIDDIFVGEIILRYGHGDPRWLGGDLYDGVGYLAVQLCTVM